MKLYPGSVKCKKPKMRDGHCGATWDICEVFDTEGGQAFTAYLNTTWGHYVYFAGVDGWRKAKIDQFLVMNPCASINTFDFRHLVKKSLTQPLT